MVTEYDWFTGDDLRGMFQFCSPLLSEHRLRAWVTACRTWYRCQEWAYDINTPDGLTAAVEDWCSDVFSDNLRVDFLRDIVGNPHRQLSFEKGSTSFGVVNVLPNIYLTNQILSLAYAAHSTQLVCACCVCDGTGMAFSAIEHIGKCVACCANRHENCFAKINAFDPRCGCKECLKCPNCKGRGYFYKESLDPIRLAILADALEDLGCDDDDTLMHLRSKKRCPNTLQTRKLMCLSSCMCKGTGWVACDSPHIQGCYVLDAILGRG